MKKLLLLFLVFVMKISIFSQIIVGDNLGTATDKSSVLLEFSAAENRGVILPYITDKSSVNTAGSLILNATTPTAARVEYYNGSSWIDLSVQNANVSSYLSIQPVANEKSNSKTILGSATSSAEGILVLESASKAMVLPKVSSVKDIINPAPGMMVLATGSGVPTLAFYNGNQWSFWNY